MLLRVTLVVEGVPTCHPGPEPSLSEASRVTRALGGREGELRPLLLCDLGMAYLFLALVFPAMEWVDFLHSSEGLSLSPETSFPL